MGLVLDELDNNAEVVVDNELNIMYDRRLKSYIDTKNGITIDYRNDTYGSGFIILGASTC